MVSTTIYLQLCVICALFIINCSSEDRYKIEYPRRNCSHIQALVRMQNFNEKKLTGSPQIMLPKNIHRYYICYSPNDFESSHQASLISHVLCRQLGYVTYENLYERDVQLGRDWSLRTENIKCLGYEQHISSCEWKHLHLERCAQVMGLECSTCSHLIEASQGTISSPGHHHHAYFYTLLCEWKIVVPENYEVQLIFQHFQLPVNYRYSLECDNSNPYVEVIYGPTNQYTLIRFCEFYRPTSMRIPFRNVTVRFSSGIYNAGLENGNHGFVILFRSESKDFLSANTMKIVTTAVGLLIFFALVISCYCCRKCEPKQYRNAEKFNGGDQRKSQFSDTCEHPANQEYLLPPNHPTYARTSPTCQIPQPIFQFNNTKNKDKADCSLQLTPDMEEMISPAKANSRSWLNNLNLRKLLRSSDRPNCHVVSADQDLSEVATPRNAFASLDERNSQPASSCSFYIYPENECINRKRSTGSENMDNPKASDNNRKIPAVIIHHTDENITRP